LYPHGFRHRFGIAVCFLIEVLSGLNCSAVAALPRAQRSKLSNRTILAGLDGRSADGRALRDLSAALLADHGGDAAPMRTKLLARAVARCQVELVALEDIEATNVSVAIDRAADIASAAKKLGVAIRKLDAALERSQSNDKPSEPLGEYLKRRAADAA